MDYSNPPKDRKHPHSNDKKYCTVLRFLCFFLGGHFIKTCHPCHASKKSSTKNRRKNGRSESQMGPAPSTSLSRPGLAGTHQRLALRLQRSGARGGVIMVVSVGKLRRLVNVWVYRGYPVQLLCRCEWENHLSKTIFPAMFDDTGGWPTKIYLILVINTGNIARNMSTSGIEVGNIGMTKHST